MAGHYLSLSVLQAQLNDAKARADKFDGLYRSLKDKVEAEEEYQLNKKPIHSEVEAVKQQMEEHKVSENVCVSVWGGATPHQRV